MKKFESDSDRRAWRTYAAAALGTNDTEKAVMAAAALGNFDAINDAEEAVKYAAKVADLMLAEEKKRRKR